MQFKVSKFVSLEVNPIFETTQNNFASGNCFGVTFTSKNIISDFKRFSIKLNIDVDMSPRASEIDELINSIITYSKNPETGKIYHMLNLSVYYLPEQNIFMGRVFNIRAHKPFAKVPRSAKLVMKINLSWTSKRRDFFFAESEFRKKKLLKGKLPIIFPIEVVTRSESRIRYLDFLDYYDSYPVYGIKILDSNCAFEDVALDVVSRVHYWFVDSDMSPDCGSSLLAHFTNLH